jgi:hypothetical protein
MSDEEEGQCLGFAGSMRSIGVRAKQHRSQSGEGQCFTGGSIIRDQRNEIVTNTVLIYISAIFKNNVI